MQKCAGMGTLLKVFFLPLEGMESNRITSFLRYSLGLCVCRGKQYSTALLSGTDRFFVPLSDVNVMICLKLKLKFELCSNQKDLSEASYSCLLTLVLFHVLIWLLELFFFF